MDRGNSRPSRRRTCRIGASSESSESRAALWGCAPAVYHLDAVFPREVRMSEEKKKRHWKRKVLFLAAAFGAVQAFLKKKKAGGGGDEAGWEEAKPSS